MLTLSKLPDRRKLSGTYLKDAVASAHNITRSNVEQKFATGQSDGWKNIAKVSVITSTMSVNREVHLVQTHDMTGLPKTGEQHALLIKEDLARMRDEFHVHPIAWVTDDGPDGKGARNLLRRVLPSLMSFLCWGHQSNLLAGDYLTFPTYKDTVDEAIEIVRWFNNHGGALDLLNQAQLFTFKRVLALIHPALTRWTTNFQSASRLLVLRRALEACVARNRETLVVIGEKSQTSNAKETARRVIASIDDKAFWDRLDRVEAHLKPLAIATNILQASHARLDHVLLTLANLYRMYGADGVEEDVREHMRSRLELRWKKGAGKDQSLFILAVFLNPYIRGYCFNRAVLPPATLYRLATEAFTRFYGCAPDPAFTDALVDYSQRQGEFSDERMQLDYHKATAGEHDKDVDIVRAWSWIDAVDEPLAICPGRNGVVKLAIRILSAAVNSAGPECVFSDFGKTHTKDRNRLRPSHVHDISTLRMALRREHAAAGFSTRRQKRKLGADYEPMAPATTSTTGTAIPCEDGDPVFEEDHDAFRRFGEDLVNAAIDSSEPDEDLDAENEREKVAGEELESRSSHSIPTATQGSEQSPSNPDSALPRSGPLVLTIDSVTASQPPLLPRRGRPREPNPVSIPLSTLFLYPPLATAPASSHGPSSSTSSPPNPAGAIGSDSDLRNRFEFIWKGGIRSLNRETQVCEAAAYIASPSAL
ncbi:hypothetical protein FKP32DRAFT_1646435 [Trametes sanguinea]|nr:hypothetical protein FKP32DRAFT_1646435 [Trametes sanguinea]